MGCGSNSTTTQTTSAPPQVMAAYQGLINQGTSVAQQPLQQYQGPVIAGFNPTQQSAFQEVNQAQGAALPYLNAAQSYVGAGATPVLSSVQSFNPYTLSQYENPYTAQVTQATQNLLNEQNAEQFNQANASAASSGAFGGDREAVLEAQMAQQQQLAEAPTLANIQSQGFTGAEQELNAQQNLQLQGTSASDWLAENAAGLESGLGTTAQNALLSGASAQMQTGGLEQQLQQEELEVPEQQFAQQQAYPFQTTNFLAGLVEGLAPGEGGIGTTTSPGPSALGTAAGLGITGLSAYNALNPSSSASAPYTYTDPYAAVSASTGFTDAGLVAAGIEPIRRGGRIRGFPRLRAAGGANAPLGGLPNILPAADLDDVDQAIQLASASPVSMPPAGGRPLPFSAPSATTQTSGGQGQAIMGDIGTAAQIAGLVAMSDPALKHVRGHSTGALDALGHMDVRNARYLWEDDGAERPMLMADSVERAAPHTVAGEAPTRAIKLHELLPLLVEGMQELDRRTASRAAGGHACFPSLARGGLPRAFASAVDGNVSVGEDNPAGASSAQDTAAPAQSQGFPSAFRSNGVPGGIGTATVDASAAAPTSTETSSQQTSPDTVPAGRGVPQTATPGHFSGASATLGQGFPRVVQGPQTGGGDQQNGFLDRFLNSPLTQIGAGMLASRSPFASVQLGEGLQNANRFQQQQAQLALAKQRANAPHVDTSGKTMRLIYPDGTIVDTGLGTGG